jgi:hypothetical protein
MAGKIYKSISAGDKVNKKDLLHEAIPITGSLVSGTYGGTTVALGSEPHIKTYSHGMFQSIYDYPYLSSSSNHLFDITCGFSSNSDLSASSPGTQQAKKINIYNQMAQVLAGHNSDGTIREFDEDGDLTGGTKIRECYFLNFSRLLTKDEIKKGSFALELGVNGDFSQVASANFSKRIKITDASGSDGYKVNSPAGEYGVLFAQSTHDGDATLSTELIENESISGGSSVSTSNPACGLIYYQAGIAVLSGSVFTSNGIATAVDCIDTTGLLADRYNDASFTISISAAAGGLGGTAITFLLDASNSTGGTGGANQIMIGTDDGISDAARAALIIKAINATTDTKVNFATSGNGVAGYDIGVTAAEGSSDTKITLTMDTRGAAGNITALASVSGVNIIDVTAFTGGTTEASPLLKTGKVDMSSTTNTQTISDLLTGSNIDTISNSIRNRIYNVSFNNTTELNSMVYFCRSSHNEFNYSSNPTYVSGSKIQVKDVAVDTPVTYVTSVGLYGPQKQLLAVAKLSEPIKKTPENEVTFRVRLDY